MPVYFSNPDYRTFLQFCAGFSVELGQQGNIIAEEAVQYQK